MIQRISELDQYYALPQQSMPSAPSLSADFLSLNNENKLVIDAKKWPALSTCILFEISRAPNDGNGRIKETNEAVSYYKSLKVGADVLLLMARLSCEQYFIENPFDLGVKGPADPCPPGGHNRYPDQNVNRVINAYCKMEFHSPTTMHNRADFHDNVFMHRGLSVKNDISGCCLSARWADLAEVYRADDYYSPGTLVAFGGEEEITIATFQANAVITEKPGLVLNSSCQTGDSGGKSSDAKFLGIALTGRTSVRVIGPVRKFDRLCISNTPGVACAKKDMPLRNTIGIALETNDDPGEKLVLSTVQLNLG